MKKMIAILLAMLLCVGLLPMTAFAAETVPFSGSGTETDPWLIENAEDLMALAAFVNEGKAADWDADAAAGGNGVAGNFYGYYFKQTANIDLTEKHWAPIGYSGSYYFAGNYDGGNYTIYNATSTGKVDNNGYATAGIFGWVAFGSVKNLHVKNANFSATGNSNYSYVGGIAGVFFASEITNCSVMNSTIESKRTPSNNNCAGSIVGYVTGSTVSNCAAENNTVKAQAYGGGFVGELDDDNGVGSSSFTNCYVAASSVTVNTTNGQDTNNAGGFVGEVTVSNLTITNCYVYDTTVAVDSTSVGSPKNVGVFAGYLWWGNYSSIVSTNCYYGKITLSGTENITAIPTDITVKEVVEFTDSTVTALLGDAFVQGTAYPVLKTLPADYSAVDDAIADAEEIDKTLYTEESLIALQEAIDAVERGKLVADQASVDAMAEAIEAAIAALVEKPKPEEPKPEYKPEPCDHKLNANGKCSRCGVIIISYENGKPSVEEDESNPDTGAESAIGAVAAIAVVAFAGAALSKKE